MIKRIYCFLSPLLVRSGSVFRLPVTLEIEAFFVVYTIRKGGQNDDISDNPGLQCGIIS